VKSVCVIARLNPPEAPFIAPGPGDPIKLLVFVQAGSTGLCSHAVALHFVLVGRITDAQSESNLTLQGA